MSVPAGLRSTASNRVTFALSLSFCLISAAAGWEFFYQARGFILAQDWMVYFTASRAALHGDYALLADSMAFMRELTATFMDVLRFSIELHPWIYPPPFLLLVLPFGVLDPRAGYVCFLLTGAAGLLLAIHVWPGSRSDRLILMASAALCPGTLFTILVGQNAFLTAALILGGIGLLDRRPALAGALLGLLLFKPQLAVLVPVVLLARREWRALAAAAGSATLFCLASLAVFGIEPWTDWLHFMLGATRQFAQWEQAAREGGMSVFASVHALSGSRGIATVAQDAAVLFAIVMTGAISAAPVRRELRVAAVLLAVELAAPHFSNYDMLIGCLGATLVWLHGVRHGFAPGELTFSLFCWVSPLTFSPMLTPLASMTPLLFAGLLCCLGLRSGLRLPSLRLPGRATGGASGRGVMPTVGAPHS